MAEKEEIRRLRKHLIWACVIGAIFAAIYFFLSLGEAFLAGLSEPSTPSIVPLGAIYLWMVLIAYRLAKALDPRFYYYWTITALMLMPVVNLIAMISLFINAGNVLSGPKTYK